MLLRSLLAALVIALATAGASATAGLMELETIIDAPAGGGPPIPPGGFDRTSPGKPQTILLLGSDRRYRDTDDDPPRSDTLMLVRLDPEQEATTVLSIPRDLRVDIPGHGLDKINDAYGLGGAPLAMRTVKALTGLEINHAVDVNFKGFRGVVDLFGCFYVDVDRRYFHSNAGVPVGQRYDAIDIRPGYQRLCGTDALDYVRYRHTDSDITRAARQQDFLRAAKDQVSTSSLIDDRRALAREFSKAAQTDADLRSAGGFLRLAKLALASADHPVRQITFPAEFARDEEREEDYVAASPVAVQAAVRRFMTGGGRAARKPARASRRRGSVEVADLEEARARGRDVVARLNGREDTLGFPLRFPSHLTERGYYEPPVRVYGLRDRAGTLHRAYRIVLAENLRGGEFYGVQGTTWRTPPLLANPSAKRKVKGRTLELFRAGQRLRFVAWRTDRAAYWISNTLGLKLSNDEMLALAASLTTT
jgi:LCP family protein required for cell wall assembly